MFVLIGKWHERGTMTSTHMDKTGDGAGRKGFFGLVVGAVGVVRDEAMRLGDFDVQDGVIR
ncbi:hypothetical protein ACC754_37845, partial [Rhizobium johnstonii]